MNWLKNNSIDLEGELNRNNLVHVIEDGYEGFMCLICDHRSFFRWNDLHCAYCEGVRECHHVAKKELK